MARDVNNGLLLYLFLMCSCLLPVQRLVEGQLTFGTAGLFRAIGAFKTIYKKVGQVNILTYR